MLPLQLVVNPVSGNGRGLAVARGLERRLRAEGYDARHVPRLRGVQVSVTGSGEPAEVLRVLPSALLVLVPGRDGR